MTTNARSPEDTHRTFLPAASYDWLLPLYDPFSKLLGSDRARQKLVDGAALAPGQRILDVGCGTGTLLVFIKETHPAVAVAGADPDPKALARARHKAERARLDVQLDQAFGDALPYADASFDRVLSSLMFHHLEVNEKAKTLREVRRVLRPGGSFHLLDFGGAESAHGGWLTRFFHSSHQLRDNSEERIIALMREAGLVEPSVVDHGAMLFGQLSYSYYRAAAPSA